MDTNPTTNHHIPVGLDIAAAWSWRLLLVIALGGVIAFALSRMLILWLPLVVAAFLAGLLNPIVNFLVRKGIPKVFATAVTFVGSIAGFAWLMALLVEQLVRGFEGIWDQAIIATREVDAFVERSTAGLPFQLPDIDLDSLGEQIATTIQSNATSLVSHAASISSSASTAITVMIIALFAGFFFMYQGKEIWAFLLTLAPKRAQGALDAGAQRGWVGVVSYVRFQAGIAVLEGLWLGLAAYLLGLPLALPLGLFVLLGAMVPILGALLTGIVAILIAFATGGLFAAFAMAVAVVSINQIETVFLQPWIMGKAVNLHPLVILLSVIGGASLGELVGALIAVPTMAFTVAGVIGIRDYLAAQQDPSATVPASTPEPAPTS